MSSWLLFAAIVTAALSGLPALSPTVQSGAWRRITCGMQLLAAVLGGAAAIAVLGDGPDAAVRLPLSPLLPAVTLGLDALSAVFLLPVCFLCGAASVFDLGYWPAASGHGARARSFLGLLFASLMALLAAQDSIAFLVAWELMALSAFFLVTTEHHQREVRTAGWIYLAATHAGTLCLIAFF
ncbi:MAG TPA: hydrogenase, partial [Planctomycetota bacterium]|nr:hydrogenase [Planctomycetota bacterium]